MCLIKSSDVSADEATRQERLREKVDDWMTGFMSRVNLSAADDAHDGATSTVISTLTSPSPSRASFASSSALVATDRTELRKSRARQRKQHEDQQQTRIRKGRKLNRRCI